MTAREDNSVTLAEWSIAIFIGLGLSLGVWWTLVQGGGLVGGDVYPYFLPQKVVLAECFENGELPLWNNHTGLGYPLLAESQAGVFYPPNQVLYRILDVNAAYNANVIIHYWLAFVFAWRFARCQHIGAWPALLSALVFVYGWFPARISWEWSIFGGVFFPLCLWLTDRLILQPTRRRGVVLAGCFAVFLLSGHFTLAFITQLTSVAYALLSVWLRVKHGEDEKRSLKPPVFVVLAILASMLLAAIQLVPTYELKRMSQRTGDSKAFDPAFGHMPPLYATQVVASWWYWHSPEVVASDKMRTSMGSIEANTNVVEAHLYWGLLPVGLMLLLLKRSTREQTDFAQCRIWIVLIAASGIYATGWLMPIARHFPGFGFFNGPGRYTLVCAMGGAMLAGHALNALSRGLSSWKTALLVLALGTLTLPDLLWSAEYVAHARPVAVSPLDKQEDSWVRQYFVAQGFTNCRLLAPGPNVGNLFEVSCVPQYLGIGPAVYYNEELWPPTGPHPNDIEFPSPDDLDKLEKLAITHILTTEQLASPSSAIELVSDFPDTMLDFIWGRGGKPCYLYRLTSTPLRVVARPGFAMEAFDITNFSANSIEFEVELSSDAEVELRELMYPGWSVDIDETPASPDNGSMMRTVSVPKGRHTVSWNYRPNSFRWGVCISFACLIASLLFAMWPPKRVAANTTVTRERSANI